jgi:hypothetical protein
MKSGSFWNKMRVLLGYPSWTEFLSFHSRIIPKWIGKNAGEYRHLVDFYPTTTFLKKDSGCFEIFSLVFLLERTEPHPTGTTKKVVLLTTGIYLIVLEVTYIVGIVHHYNVSTHGA